MNKKKINVLVTGSGGGGHGEQILKALRMSDLDYTIIGVDMSNVSIGLAMADHAYLVPPCSQDDYMDHLLAVCRKHDVKALFHGNEPELNVISRNREMIEREGIFLPVNPQEVMDTCMDKSKTMQFLADNGFHFPRSITVTSPGDLKDVDFFPVVLKPSIGAGGSANIMLAQNPKELEMFGQYLLQIYPEFIIQEYMGTPDSEYTVGVLFSMDGEFINSIAVKRYILSALSNRIKVPNQTGNSSLGKMLAISSGVSQGEIGPFPEVAEPCIEIVKKLGCRGSVNIQCRFVDGKVYVFEINPRFSGTTSLRAMVGYNEPDILIRKHLLGEVIEPNFKYKSGCILRGLKEVFIENKPIPSAKELM